KFVQIHRIGDIYGNNEFDIDGRRVVLVVGALLRLGIRRGNACVVTRDYGSRDNYRSDRGTPAHRGPPVVSNEWCHATLTSKSGNMRRASHSGSRRKRFVEGADRGQSTLLPECIDEWVEESNCVRVVDCFVDALDLADLGFEGVEPAATGRPAYHPSVLLKLYIYGYLNRVQSSRRLEREAGRNLEIMWLVGRLVPDHKTIADFRKDNGPAIGKVCAQFVAV